MSHLLAPKRVRIKAKIEGKLGTFSLTDAEDVSVWQTDLSLLLGTRAYCPSEPIATSFLDPT